MGTRHVWLLAVVACGSPSGTTVDAPQHAGSDAAVSIDAPAADPASLQGERDRLLATYLAYLQTVSAPQSNGLGNNVHSVCELWTGLVPSSQQVFLTITHRLYGSRLDDASRMLDHITVVYRIVSGENATATAAGSCGGGEFNRMIMQEDPNLHAKQVLANSHQGAQPYDITDVIAGGYWRDSHDVGGPHAPFDLSDETNDGAPRGQTQYFKDPASAVANAPLGRQDLMTLVDPYALEMDQDYDCTHNSNPACDYIFYGTACAPAADLLGTQIYSGKYGDFAPGYVPTGC